MSKQIVKLLLFSVSLSAVGLFFVNSGPAEAANPTTVNFQGKVVNSDGTNVTNGTYSFVFRIYNTASPTTTTACSSDGTCLYEETQASVTVTNGIFQVELGSGCSGGLVASNTCTKSVSGGLNFSSNSALYLTLQFNGDTSGAHGGYMWPVIHFTSTPYAYFADNAGSLGGLTASGFIQNSSSLQSSSDFHVSGTGQANTALQAPLFDSQTSNTTLGIGTTNASVITLGNTANSSFIFKTKNSTTAVQIQNASSYNVLVIDTTNSHLKIYENTASPTNYVDLYYDNATSTAFVKASNGTTQVGSGSGPINIIAGAGSALTLTGHANSTLTTDSGYFRLDAASGIQLGAPSGSNNGLLVFNNSGGSGTASFTLAGNPSANYTYQLPTGAVGSNQCLQSGTLSGNNVPLTFSACGGGASSVSYSTSANANGGSISGSVLTLNKANATNPGLLSADSQTIGGAKTFSTNATVGFQVQDSSNSKAILGVDTSADQVVLGVQGASGLNGKIQFNTTNASNTYVALAAASTGTSFTLTLPTTLPGASNYCIVSTNLGAMSFSACGAGSTATASLVPEFPGAVMTGDGSANTGTMTSDFCGNDGAGSFADLNTGVCNTSGDFHNYYNWTSTGANDYEIFTRWRVPNDFSSFSTVQFNSKKSATGDDVKLTIYTNSGAACGTGTSMTNTASAWQTTTYTISGCSPAAGDMLTFDIHMAVAANANTCQIGEIPITYNRK